MKKIIPLSIALTFAGVCCIVAAYFCHFYYTLYRHASTDLESSVDSRIKQLQWDVERLAKQKHFTPIRATALISTTDQQAEDWMGAGTNSTGGYHLGNSKLGWVVCPELRLPAGSVALHEFKITLSGRQNQVMDAWISPPAQPEALAAFQTIAVQPDEGTNSLTLRVRAKPGSSVKHQFTMVVLMDNE